jgi:hypothetical protein
MEMPDRADTLIPRLREFPTDLAAVVALARIASTQGQRARFDELMSSIIRLIAIGADRKLTWDRRVALAIVLADGKQYDLSRAQIGRCLREIDEASLCSLSAGSLVNLHVLMRAFELTISDAALRELALNLTPPASRPR